MVTSKIFEKNYRIVIEKKIKNLLNNNFDVSKIEWPWAIGDFLGDNFDKILGNICKNYSSAFARRAMADLAFTDKDNFYYIIDVKTHRLDTGFNMPNITSVERLSRFYEDDSNYFVVLNVDYEVKKTKAIIKKAIFTPIEFLSWECLTLGALGWGQIQIANSNFIKVISRNKRKKWMIELCDNLLAFYPREIGKINDRVIHFKKVKKYWQAKKE